MIDSNEETRTTEQSSADSAQHSNARVIAKESVVEVATRHSAKDVVLWIIALAGLIAATLLPNYLTGIWQPASNTWVKVAMTVGFVIVALICLALTHQGSAFKTLLKDAGIELRRITWPSKQETTTYTWQVLVVTVIAGILIWLLDNLFNYVIGWILG